MSVHERLKRARSEAGYETAVGAARAFGWNVNTYISNENGHRTYGREKASDYARAFRVNVGWLLEGKGPMRRGGRSVDVVGFVGAGAAVYPLDEGGFDPVDPRFDAPPNSIAFIVRGDSMYPMFVDGSYIIAEPIEDPRQALGARVVVTLDDGRRFVKELLSGSKSGLFSLHAFNSPPMLDVRVVACARVLAVVFP